MKKMFFVTALLAIAAGANAAGISGSFQDAKAAGAVVFTPQQMANYLFSADHPLPAGIKYYTVKGGAFVPSLEQRTEAARLTVEGLVTELNALNQADTNRFGKAGWMRYSTVTGQIVPIDGEWLRKNLLAHGELVQSDTAVDMEMSSIDASSFPYKWGQLVKRSVGSVIRLNFEAVLSRLGVKAKYPDPILVAADCLNIIRWSFSDSGGSGNHYDENGDTTGILAALKEQKEVVKQAAEKTSQGAPVYIFAPVNINQNDDVNAKSGDVTSTATSNGGGTSPVIGRIPDTQQGQSDVISTWHKTASVDNGTTITSQDRYYQPPTTMAASSSTRLQRANVGLGVANLLVGLVNTGIGVATYRKVANFRPVTTNRYGSGPGYGSGPVTNGDGGTTYGSGPVGNGD